MSMNHHGAFPHPSEDRRPDGLISELMQKFDKQVKGTKQREFPKGRVGADDDGELVYIVGSDAEQRNRQGRVRKAGDVAGT